MATSIEFVSFRVFVFISLSNFCLLFFFPSDSIIASYFVLTVILIFCCSLRLFTSVDSTFFSFQFFVFSIVYVLLCWFWARFVHLKKKNMTFFALELRLGVFLCAVSFFAVVVAAARISFQFFESICSLFCL